MLSIELLAAKKNRDAIVPPWDDDPVTLGFESRRATPTEAVCKDDGIDIISIIERINLLLQCAPEDIGPIMQTHFKIQGFGNVVTFATVKLNFLLENRTGYENKSWFS
jgi:hypothetical protein